MMGTLDDYRWLVSPAATAHLRLAADSAVPLHTLAETLRRELTPTRAHLVLEQTDLRARGRKKFSRADELFFTPVGLEQATDQFVAAYKAGRFPRGQAVADLCCGIGGDLMALAARGPVLAVDRDEVNGVLALANCATCGVSPQSLQAAEVGWAHVADCAAWHIDPDRRVTGRRTTRVELYEPGPKTIASLLAANPTGAIKLAPAADVPEEWLESAELEWISRGRECRQLVVWGGALARSPQLHRATVLGSTAESLRSIAGLPTASHELPAAPAIGRYLFDPDPAVLAAHLEGLLAAEHQLSSTSNEASYLTGDTLIHDAALAAFEVTDVFPLRIKPLKQLLRARGIGRLEIKKRSVPVDIDELRRSLAVTGDESATLLLTRLLGAVTAVLAKRVTIDSGQWTMGDG